ncbi:MAG: hypothetical protein AAF409_01065 [Pseudomonadota bacterium]
MKIVRRTLGPLLLAAVLAACAATNQVGFTRPDVPPAPADRWTMRNNDGAGNPTLSTATIAWREAVVGSTAGMNLVADCRPGDLGRGIKLSLERDQLPRDAFRGEAINLSAVVRGRSSTIRRESIGTVPFEGFGVDQSGGYLFKPTDRLVRAMQRGSTITISSPAFGDIRFSLNGASKALVELGCV